MHADKIVLLNSTFDSSNTFFTDRPFAVSHSRGTKLLCWSTTDAPGQEKQRAHIMIYNGNQFLCLSSSSASLALQHGGLLPRESGADPDLQIRGEAGTVSKQMFSGLSLV